MSTVSLSKQGTINSGEGGSCCIWKSGLWFAHLCFLGDFTAPHPRQPLLSPATTLPSVWVLGPQGEGSSRSHVGL